MNAFKDIRHDVQFCIVGGGLSGLCAAIAAARNGVKTLLMQERPMLGGNASSEIRMWVCGADGSNNRETGLIEEIEMENAYRNPYKNFSIWDSVLYEKARAEENLTLLLNCSCMDAEMDGQKIRCVRGWQMTTQTFHTVYAHLFSDCSGDSVLAPLTGAPYRRGRESSAEFNEDIEPPVADEKTMGLTCLIQFRQQPYESTFIPPTFAEHYTPEDLRHRIPDMTNHIENFWYMELGGEGDTIGDTEALRDELQAVAYGMADFVKNSGHCGEAAKTMELDWVGMLPGKRESRRYEGDYIMTQHDVRAGGPFEDTVAYGGWPMDDHDPAGFRTTRPPTTYHRVPVIYGIPYRCLYSRTVENLYFAGRNISLSHAAMSSARVMATCATLGQAVGTAAAIAEKYGILPREVNAHMQELQQLLMEQDSYLPGIDRILPELTLQATIVTDGENGEALRDGFERSREDNTHYWKGGKDSSITLKWDEEKRIEGIRIVFDSDLNRATWPDKDHNTIKNALCNRFLHTEPIYVPKTMVRDFIVEARNNEGEFVPVCAVKDNHKRLFLLKTDLKTTELRLRPLSTWGMEEYRVFSFEAK